VKKLSKKENKKMKKEKITRSFIVIAIILLGLFILLAETCGADSKSPATKTGSKSQISQMPKTIKKQSSEGRLTPVKRPTASPSSFKPDMPFSEAIDILRNSTVPPLNIAVLWKDLQENADIYRDTPIGMNGLSGVPLRTHLKVLLMSVSGGAVEKLGFVVDDGVIIIATQSSLPKKEVTRIYDITDLVSEPANYRLMPGFGMPLGFGGMPFGGMMPFGGAGFGGMMPFGGTSFGGQGLFNSPSIGGSYGGFNRIRAGR
jgi:hypothetical protein